MASLKRVKRTDEKGRKYEALYVVENYIDNQGKRKQKVLKKLGRLGKDIDMRGAKRALAQYIGSDFKITEEYKFETVLEEFKEYYQLKIGQSISEGTYKAFEYESNKLQDLYHKKLKDIDFTVIEEWKNKMKKTTELSNTYINKCLLAMKKVLVFAKRKGYISTIPDWDMLSLRKFTPEIHSKDEVLVLLEKSKSNISLHRYLRLMLTTGIRPQEATALEHKDICLKTFVLKIRSDNKLKRGREIPISEAFAKELDSWYQETGKVCPYETTSGVQTVMSRFARRLNIGFSCYPKKLRSTYASLMVQEDANPFRLAELMGNSVKVLQEYYVRHNRKALSMEAQKNPILDSLI